MEKMIMAQDVAHRHSGSRLEFGSRVRKSPFFEATQRYGCKAYSVYNHMYMPLYYADPITDYWRLVNGVTVWDVACERQVEVVGPDALRLIQQVTTRNPHRCAVGQCKYVMMTAEDGGLINDPVLLRLGDHHFWLSVADSDVLLWVKGVALGSGYDVTVREPDVSPLQIQGPQSTNVVRDLFGDWILGLNYFRFQETEWNGAPLILSRTGWSNEHGYEIFLRDHRFGDELWEAIMAVGEPNGIRPGAPSQIKRIEAGLFSYRTDMDLSTNPYELGLDRFVDLDQAADFIGKLALKRIKAAGIKQKMVGIEIPGEPLPGNEHPWPVTHHGQPAGRLTSCVYSPSLETNIGYVMTSVHDAEVGTSLTVQAPWGNLAASVRSLPFIKNRATA